MNKEIFLTAIREIKVVKIKFIDKKGNHKNRNCIPYDYAYSNIENNPEEQKYHFYDLDSPDGSHNLSLSDKQIITINITDESFNPANYIKWTPNWTVKRNWGKYS